MTIFKKKIFWIIIVIILVAAFLVFILKPKTDSQEYLSEPVKLGKLIQSVSATGKIESASQSDLNFTISGKLAAIFAKDGDKIKRGQLLAKLESNQQQSTVNKARAQVTEAKANLDSVLAGYSNENIAITQAKVQQAQADLNSKETAFDNATVEQSENLNSYKEQGLDAASKSLLTINNALEGLDEIINNYEYENGFKVFNISFNEAVNSYNTAITQLTVAESASNNFSIDSEVGDLVEYLDIISQSLNNANNALNSAFDLFSIVEPVYNITQANINSWKTTVSTDQTGIAAEITATQSAKANLQIKSVEYDNAINNARADIEKAQTALEVAQAELELKLAEPRGFEVDLQNARVKMAEASLQAALADLADYSLVAPVDGVVTKIHYKLGEFVSSNKPAISLIGESNLQIEVDVPESDIAKIKVGDIAEITLDAFGEDKKFTSHIAFIDPAETLINDVVYYKVKIVFDEKDEQIKSGMTANVVIITATRENVLYIPLRAVIENGKKIVRILENNQKVEREVQIGLKADDGLVEILSGLSEGEIVITYIKNGK